MATADTIKQYYVNILQRDPTATESSYWVATVDSGALTLTQVRDSLASGSEATTYVDQIVRIYQAAFGRKPDVTGIDGWTDQLRADNTALFKIAGGFVNSTEWKNRYGDNTVNDAVLQALYQNVLGRTGSAAEIAAWKATGQSMSQILIGFSNSAEFASKAAPSILALKQAAADVATSALNTVFTGSGALFDPAAGNGQTYTLTVNSDAFNGTAGNDTFSAPVVASGGVANQVTLNPLDNLDGGAGDDTLRVENTGGVQGITGTIKNIEHVAFLGTGNVNVNAAIDATPFSKSVELELTDDVAVAVNNVSGQTLIMDRVANNTVLTSAHTATATKAAFEAMGPLGNATFNYAGAQIGSASLKVDKTATGSAVTLTDTGNTTKSASVDASGASTVVVNSTALESVAVTGKGAVSLSMGTAASNGIDASKSEGGVTVTTAMANGATFTGGDGKDSITLGATTKAHTMGKGDDTVTLTGSALGAGGSADGGEGTDTLSMTSANAATASVNDTFEKSISGFEKVQLGQVAGGAADTINLANIDDISFVKSAGTAAATGTAEVQTYTVTAGADANGGNITFGGVDINIASGATANAVAAAIAAQQAAIIAANPLIASVAAVGNVVTVTYNQFAADQANLAVAQGQSGVTFGVVNETNGTNPVNEVQTLQVTAASTATGQATVNVNGTNVFVTLTSGQTIAQQTAAIAAAITAANVPNLASATSNGVDTVTLTFGATGAADPAQVTFTAGGATGAAATAATTVAHVAPAAETQTFTVTNGTDATGGSVLIGGVRVELGANLTVDQVGTAVAAAQAAIIAGNPTVASVAYNTGNDTVTVTYTAAAGNVGAITVADNNASAVAITATEVTPGVAGTAGGILNLTNMTSGGTLELTGAIGGASSVAIKDAATGAADVFNLKLNGAANIVNTAALTVASVETVNIETTDSTTATDPTAASSVILNATSATSVMVKGNHGVNMTGSTLTGLTTFDASGVTATGAAGAVTFATGTTDKNVSIKGGAGNDVLSGASTTDATKVVTIDGGAGNDTIIGGAGKDVLSGSAGNDTVTGGAGADTISLGAGNDKIVINAIADSVLASRDVISDFSANTFGNGTAGAAGTGAGAAANWTGDVVSINISAILGGGAAAALADGVVVGVQNNAANAQTFLQNLASSVAPATDNAVGVALDSSTGLVYIDVNSDGVIDSVIEMTGVTNLTAAAFELF